MLMDFRKRCSEEDDLFILAIQPTDQSCRSPPTPTFDESPPLPPLRTFMMFFLFLSSRLFGGYYFIYESPFSFKE
jgi:hypothetical protein